MAELEPERQLLTAYRALSTQYETEQRRHSEQVAALEQRFEQQAAEIGTLRQQFEQQAAENRTLRQLAEQQAAEIKTLRQLVEFFGGQVMRSTEDLRTLAETLRRRWK